MRRVSVPERRTVGGCHRREVLNRDQLLCAQCQTAPLARTLHATVPVAKKEALAMTLPPCWTPPDDDLPPNESRRNFLIGSAVATAAAIVAPLLAEPERATAPPPN